MQIPPKAGRLATGAFGTFPIDGDCFPTQSQPSLQPANVGGLVMPNDRTLTIYGHPFSTQRNVTRQRDLAAITSFENVVLLSPEHVPLIQPHERGRFFMSKPTPIDKTQFGATGEKSSDTSFHPQKKVVNPPSQPRSAKAGERTAASSFPTNGNNWYDPNNSFVGGIVTPAGHGVGRWGITKKGVV